jgi:hypothetical protein
VVNHLEAIMHSLYKYFSNFPKRHIELGKFGEIMEIGPRDFEWHQDPLDFYVKPIQMGVIIISSIIVEDGI